VAPLPAHWALGYHQCRWNYVSSDDVRGVQNRFDEEDMPFDVLWLDIEYSKDHQYMIWDQKHFPDPVEMTNEVAALGRKVGRKQAMVDQVNFLTFSSADGRNCRPTPEAYG
jgi:alpha 1,3-glucosidase